MLARLRLVEEYRLAGISIWTINQRNRPLWKVIEGAFNAEKLL